MSKSAKYLAWAIIIIAYIGLMDASYLSFKHFDGGFINCILGEGCDTVTTSEYSYMFGIPVALLGFFFYLTTLFVSIYYLVSNNKKAARILPLLGTIGFLASLRFVLLQIYVIKAICTYCMLSATTSTLIFILSIFLAIKLAPFSAEK